MKKALRPGGVIATQAESPYLLPDIVQRLYKVSEQVFRSVGYASILVPTYPDRNHRRLRGRRPRRHRVAGAPGSAGVGREAQVLQLEDSRGRVRESVFRETALRLICADGVFGQGPDAPVTSGGRRQCPRSSAGAFCPASVPDGP